LSALRQIKGCALLKSYYSTGGIRGQFQARSAGSGGAAFLQYRGLTRTI